VHCVSQVLTAQLLELPSPLPVLYALLGITTLDLVWPILPFVWDVVLELFQLAWVCQPLPRVCPVMLEPIQLAMQPPVPIVLLVNIRLDLVCLTFHYACHAIWGCIRQGWV